jgi:hypothetical protein
LQLQRGRLAAEAAEEEEKNLLGGNRILMG